MYSVVIPVYQNEASLDRLIEALVSLSVELPTEFEVVFVVDGSPDRSLEILRERLPGLPFHAQLLSLTRNFGSFCAIAAGLQHAKGDWLAVMAADLQEPPELIRHFYEILSGGRADIVFGVRSERSDPWYSRAASNFFWWAYRGLVVQDMPRGGVDIFGCTREVRDQLTQFREVNTNLIALLFWLGYRREYVTYARLPRLEGRSAWTVRKKLRYGMNGIFNFTDLPVQLLLAAGAISLVLACGASVAVLIAKLRGNTQVPGYTAIMLAVLFFGALVSLGLGTIGQYLWLALQNVRGRPNFIVRSSEHHATPRRVASKR